MRLDEISIEDRAQYYILLALERENRNLLIDELIEKTVAVLYQNRELYGYVSKILEIDIDIDIGPITITNKTRAAVFNIVFLNNLATTGHFKGIAMTDKGRGTLDNFKKILAKKTSSPDR